jgi:hypothetical protein
MILRCAGVLGMGHGWGLSPLKVTWMDHGKNEKENAAGFRGKAPVDSLIQIRDSSYHCAVLCRPVCAVPTCPALLSRLDTVQGGNFVPCIRISTSRQRQQQSSHSSLSLCCNHFLGLRPSIISCQLVVFEVPSRHLVLHTLPLSLLHKARALLAELCSSSHHNASSSTNTK